MVNKKQLDMLTIIIAWTLSFRDYVYAFSESLSPIISIFIYGLLFLYFFLDLFFFSNFSLPKSLAIVLSCILVVTFFHFSSYPILTIFLFVYLLRNLPLKRVISIFFYPRIIMTFIIVVLYHLGLTNDVATTITYKLGGGVFHTMGISANPNTTSTYFFSTIMLTYLYVKIFKKKFLYFLPLLICIYIVQVTLSRTVLMSTVALYIFDIIFMMKKNNFIVKCCLFLPFLYIILTFFLALKFSDNIIVNGIFSLRPMYWNDYLSQLSINEIIFGSSDSKGVTVDSGFLRIFINGGVFLYIPILILLKKSLVRYNKNDSPYFVFILTCFTYSFMESLLMTQLRDITVLVFLFLYKMMVYNSKSQKIRIRQHSTNMKYLCQ